MLNKKSYKTLRFKATITIILALFISVGTYFLLSYVSDSVIEKAYLSEDKISERETNNITNFDTFVKENHIKSTDYDAIKKWCNKQKYVYFMLFDNDSLRLVVDGKNSYEYESGQVTNSEEYNLHPINFDDGDFSVSMIEYSESLYYQLSGIVGFAISVIIFFAIVLYFLMHIIKRIRDLSENVDVIATDDINISLLPDQNDEIGDLSTNIDKMRKSIIYHYEKEKESSEANKELITNMSHDIRTPLTAIIGYNEMMVNGDNDIETMKQFADYSLEKANQLKNMSDKLFKYFLVYDANEMIINSQSTSALLLFQQIIGEQTILLHQQGYETQFFADIEDATINVDIEAIKRVFDNVFSNIKKYADIDKPITIKLSRNDKTIKIIISDYISKNIQTTESTGIGLKSCKKIMTALDGDFQTQTIDDTFISIITITI